MNSARFSIAPSFSSRSAAELSRVTGSRSSSCMMRSLIGAPMDGTISIGGVGSLRIRFCMISMAVLPSIGTTPVSMP